MYSVYTYYFNNQEDGVAMLIPDKVDFKTKNISDTKRCLMATNGSSLSRGQNNPKSLCT